MIDRVVGRWGRHPATRAGVAVVVAALVVVGCSNGSAPDDEGAYRVEFIAACQAGVGGATGVGACGCWYERLLSDVPFEELPDLDVLTAPDAAEDAVNPELYELLADCVRAFGAAGEVPATAPPPLTLPAPPTTTTLLVEE